MTLGESGTRTEQGTLRLSNDSEEVYEDSVPW